MGWWSPARWTAWALAHRRWAVSLLLLPSLVAVAGVFSVETEVGYRAFLGAGHPVVREFDAFVDRFGGGLPLVAVWTCPDGVPCATALSDEALAMAAQVARELDALEEVRRVDSPATTPLLVPRAIGLPTARRLFADGRPSRDIEALRRWALTDPTWVRRLVSEDGRAGALVIHLRDSAGDTAESAYAALRRATQPFAADGFEFSYVGGPVEFVVAGAALQRNTQRILPVMIGVIAAVLMLLFGSPAAALSALLAVGVAIVWVIGAMGWLGWPDNSLMQILPPLILVVGVCDAIHLLGRYAEMPAALGAEEAMLRATAEVGPPCALTTATTVVGFGSLAVSGLESISRFGVLASLAVAVALLVSFIALPLAVTRMPRRWFGKRAAGDRWASLLERTAAFATGSGRRPILVVALLLGVGGGWAARDLQVDASFEDLYGADSPVVVWANRTAELLRAPDTLEITLQPPAGSGVGAVGFALADAVEGDLERIDGLAHPLSIVDVLRRLNQWLHRDELPLGESDDAKGRPTSVYRLLRSRDPEVTTGLVDPDSGALRISLESEKPPQEELRGILEEVDRRIAQRLPPGWSAVVTGPLAVVGRMIDAIRLTQLRSFALAAVAILVLVALFFRSVWRGLLGMVPTVLPVLVTLGAMAWRGVALDIGTAMVASVVVGLAVDDAIHWLSAFVTARGAGADGGAAARQATRRTGRAIVTTSLALATGFTTLSFSAWHSIASFGGVAAVAILAALAAALLVLPALASR